MRVHACQLESTRLHVALETPTIALSLILRIPRPIAQKNPTEFNEIQQVVLVGYLANKAPLDGACNVRIEVFWKQSGESTDSGKIGKFTLTHTIGCDKLHGKDIDTSGKIKFRPVTTCNLHIAKQSVGLTISETEF